MNHESKISLYHVQNTIEEYLSSKCIPKSCEQKDEYFTFNLGLNNFIIGYVKYDKDGEFIRIELSSDRRFIDLRQDNIYIDHNSMHILPNQEPVHDMFDELIASFKVYLYDNESYMNTKMTEKEVRVIDTDKFTVGRAYRIHKLDESDTHDVICANVTERVVSFVLYNETAGISDMLILGAEPAFGAGIDDYVIQKLYPKE